MKNPCPVLPLAREAQRLADAISAADEAGDHARAAALYGQLQAIEIAASRLKPTTGAGARYQIRLMAVLADRIDSALPMEGALQCPTGNRAACRQP